MLTFGPVPSRRLGQSLGINNIPPKTCSYSCVYCQVGSTTQMSIKRRTFYRPEEILQAAREKLDQARAANAPVDFLTFVPDGEPTLDVNLGREILSLRSLRPKIGVISNASLTWQAEVRTDLARADWVSLKVDSVRRETWRKIDRAHGSLDLNKVLDGILSFARIFEGELVTETMLVHGVNDDETNLAETASFLSEVRPARAYLSIPTRPPTEPWVQAPREESLHRAFRIFKAHVEEVEFLIAYEGDAFAATSDVGEDILSITAVHPMREGAVVALLEKAGADRTVIEDLIARGSLARVEYEGEQFYIRRFSRTD